MTANVKTVQDSGDTAALLFLEGEPKGIWTPDRELARTLLGKPIPSDWLRKPNKQGTGEILLPPKKGGGGGGYRQSKEAFESEAKSRAVWQAIEEEKKDRRTALMQAVTIADEDDPGGIVVIAELFYDWLRETSGAVAGGIRSSAQEPAPDSTPSVSGEVAAGQEPGEGSSLQSKTSPGSTKIYPIDAAKCDHKSPSGRWITWNSEGRCPRCGTPKVSAVEGTTADLSA